MDNLITKTFEKPFAEDTLLWRQVCNDWNTTDGVYGGRFSGAGFKGCCMALIDPAFEESIVRSVEDAYLKVFPELAGKYSTHICNSANGIINME